MKSASDWENTYISALKNALWWLTILDNIMLYVQIEVRRNEIDSYNIIHVYIHAKTVKAVK